MKSVCFGLPRTAEGARTAIKRYEEQNSDLPAPTRRMMALSACGKYFGRRVLEEATGQKLPRLPFRDWSWRWWNALNLAGLGSLWPGFVAQIKIGGLDQGARYVELRSSAKRYQTFLCIAGTNPRNHHKPVRDILWTKGGCWRIESSLTKLLVLKQHLPERTLVTQYQKTLGHHKVRLLERELMNLIDPDTMMSSEAKHRALDYVRRRIPEMLGWKRKRVGYEMAAWFFQQKIPVPDGTVVPDRRSGYVTRKWGSVRHNRDWQVRSHWSV